MEKLALFDFDNVIYRGHSVFDVIQAQEADGFMNAGVWKTVEEQLVRYKKKEATYTEAADKMLAAWAEGLKGKRYEDAVGYVSDYFNAHPGKFFAWFEKVTPTISKSHDIFIVSTNYQFITEAVVRRFGLNGYLSSEAAVSNGVFTGKVGKSLAGSKGEVASLLEGYSREGSIAVGDSENDIEMLEKVEFPICFQPDEKLTSIARKRNWRIVNENTVVPAITNLLK